MGAGPCESEGCAAMPTSHDPGARYRSDLDQADQLRSAWACPWAERGRQEHRARHLTPPGRGIASCTVTILRKRKGHDESKGFGVASRSRCPARARCGSRRWSCHESRQEPRSKSMCPRSSRMGSRAATPRLGRIRRRIDPGADGVRHRGPPDPRGYQAQRGRHAVAWRSSWRQFRRTQAPRHAWLLVPA